jgi:hypothetical protein
MYTHVSKCKNNKIKGEKINKNLKKETLFQKQNNNKKVAGGIAQLTAFT